MPAPPMGAWPCLGALQGRVVSACDTISTRWALMGEPELGVNPTLPEPFLHRFSPGSVPQALAQLLPPPFDVGEKDQGKKK